MYSIPLSVKLGSDGGKLFDAGETKRIACARCYAYIAEFHGRIYTERGTYVFFGCQSPMNTTLFRWVVCTRSEGCECQELSWGKITFFLRIHHSDILTFRPEMSTVVSRGEIARTAGGKLQVGC